VPSRTGSKARQVVSISKKWQFQPSHSLVVVAYRTLAKPFRLVNSTSDEDYSEELLDVVDRGPKNAARTHLSERHLRELRIGSAVCIDEIRERGCWTAITDVEWSTSDSLISRQRRGAWPRVPTLRGWWLPDQTRLAEYYRRREAHQVRITRRLGAQA
jgi:hypothetical protein